MPRSQLPKPPYIIDGRVKDQASKVLAEMGLSVSDAIRLLLVRVAADKALPFAVKIPNAETQAAIEEARRGGLKSATNIQEMLKQLNADD